MANTEKILLNNVSKGRLNEEKMKALLAESPQRRNLDRK